MVLNDLNLKLYDFVKLANNYESFWVKIVYILDNNTFIGIIDNYLINNLYYDYGNYIYFKKNNIIKIYKNI